MNIKEEIDKWVETTQNDLHCFPSEEHKNIVRNLFYKLSEQDNFFFHFLENKKGLIVYCITPDFRGILTVQELFMYIKPEHRGSIRLFKELINHIEQFAKENGCSSVRIGANLQYKDEKILKVLKLLGYQDDAVVKYIGE